MEKQADHRMSLERVVVTGDNRRANYGLICGFIIAVLGLCLSAFLIYSGFATAGVVFAVTELATLVGVFVYGTNSRRRERVQKARNPSEAERGKKRD